jgi:hypothetical protein
MAIPLSTVSIVTAAPPAAPPDDYPVPMGHFFTQAAGPGETGFAVTDEGGILMWSEFQRLGGVNAVGYPVSERFMWSGFVCQAMQRVVFQWRPDIGQVYFVNVFDMMTAAGKDDWLLAVRQTPKPYAFNEAGKTWDQIVNMRLAVLDANPAIKAAYYGVVGDPVTMNGLPTSMVSDMGNNFTLRAQRVVIQQWKVAVPWAAAGQVTFALGGSIAKEAGLLPTGGMPLLPDPTPSTCAGPPVISSFTSDAASITILGSTKLKWGAVTNADTVAIDQGIGGVAAPGEVEVSPNVNTTYTMTANGCGGTTQKQVTINVIGIFMPPLTVLPLARDLGAGNLQMPGKQIQVYVQRSGTFAAGSTFKWRLYRNRPLFGDWNLVKDGTSAVPAAPGAYISTGYLMTAPGIVYGSKFRFVIDPDNLIVETNEGNNVREETCDYTANTCS